jgi:hypothetical protein
VCGKYRYGWFVRNVERAVEDHGLKYFWTLTLDHKDVPAAKSWDLIMEAWNRFRTALRADIGALSYIWCVEPQSSGHAHLHILWDRWVPHAQVKELWSAASGGSYIVYVERVRGGNVSRYLAKYCGKLAGRVLVDPALKDLSGRKRFSKSRDIVFSPWSVSEGSWRIYRIGWKSAIEELSWADFRLRVVGGSVPRAIVSAPLMGGLPSWRRVGSAGWLDDCLIYDGRSPPLDSWESVR